MHSTQKSVIINKAIYRLKHEEKEEEEKESEKEEESEDKNEKEEEEEREKEEEEKDVSYGSITDIYGRVLKGKEDALKQFTSKYVPPHLREGGKQEEKPAVEDFMLKSVREVVNKVTDENFIAMCNVRRGREFHRRR